MSKYQIEHDYFKAKLNSVSAYILGFIWADGHVRKDGYAVTIKLNKRDRDIIEYIRKKLGSDHPIKPRSENRVQVDFCSSQLTRDVRDLGFPSNKTFAETLPEFGGDPLPFIRGVFDGDGSISQDKKGQWHMQVTGNITTCNFVHKILKCGNVYKDHNVFKWQVGGSLQVRKVCKQLLRYKELPLTRKMKKAMEATNGDS